MMKTRKRKPYLMIMMRIVMMIKEDHGDGDDEVHVVDLATPDAVQHEEELDEDAAKGKNASHDDSRDWLEFED